jgi:hypothetical protein
MQSFLGSKIYGSAKYRLGYRFYRALTYYAIVRDTYEAVVICSFLILLCNFLGSDLHNTILSKPRRRLSFPVCCISTRPRSWYYLETLKWFILQYAIIGPVVGLVSIVLETQGLLCPESLSFKFGKPWLLIIQGISTTMATFSVFELYMVIRPELKYVSKCLVDKKLLPGSAEISFNQTCFVHNLLPRPCLGFTCSLRGD